MKNGFCPKCRSTDILRFDGGIGPYGSGFSALSAVSVNRYVCCSCGFTEE